MPFNTTNKAAYSNINAAYYFHLAGKN